MTCINYMKFKFQCLSVKCYWNTATPIQLHTMTVFVLQLSWVVVTEIIWPIKQNIYYLAFFRKRLPYFFLEQVYAALEDNEEWQKRILEQIGMMLSTERPALRCPSVYTSQTRVKSRRLHIIFYLHAYSIHINNSHIYTLTHVHYTQSHTHRIRLEKGLEEHILGGPKKCLQFFK